MAVQYPLVVFTLLLCFASGIFAIQGWLLYKGKGSKKFHQLALIVEFAALCVGGFASFLHLHHWERIFNGFGHLTSGITQELIGMVVIVLAIVIVFMMMRKAEGGEPSKMPQWVGIMALAVGIILGFVCAHSYAMPARPAWNNFTLYLFYYASEFILGAAGIWLLSAITKEDDDVVKFLAKLTFIAAIVSAVIMVICVIFYSTIGYDTVGIMWDVTDPTQPAADPSTSLAAPLSGAEAPLFWGGAVCVGALVPAVLAYLKMKTPQGTLPFAVITCLCTLVGGICFRIVWYAVAIGFYVYY